MKKMLVPATVGAFIGLVFWLIAVFASDITALVLIPVSVVFIAIVGTVDFANPWLVGIAQMVYFALVALAINFLFKSQIKLKRLLLVSFAAFLISVHTLVYYQTRLNQINEVAAKAIVDALVKIVKERDPAIFGSTKPDQNNESTRATT